MFIFDAQENQSLNFIAYLKHSKKVAFCLTLLSVLTSTWMMYCSINPWLNQKAINVSLIQENVSNETIRLMNKEQVDIAAYHIFGTKRVVNLEPKTIVTNLALTLTGILTTGKSKNESSAIIAKVGGNERVYYVGDYIPGGAKLLEVQDDLVVILNDDQLEKLVLKKRF